MKLRLPAPAALAVALTLLLLPQAAAPAGAQAAGSAYNTYREYLNFPAPVGYWRCASRRIWLASATYNWTRFYKHWAYQAHAATRTIYLQAGWYRWEDCNGYFERASGGYRYVYRLRSRLRQESTGGYAESWFWENGDHGSGTYDVGSSLTRL
jgi:hypothetical protein